MHLTPEVIAGLLLGFDTFRVGAHLAQKDSHLRSALAQTMLESIADGSLWQHAIFDGKKAEVEKGQEPAFVAQVIDELLRQQATREVA